MPLARAPPWRVQDDGVVRAADSRRVRVQQGPSGWLLKPHAPNQKRTERHRWHSPKIPNTFESATLPLARLYGRQLPVYRLRVKPLVSQECDTCALLVGPVVIVRPALLLYAWPRTRQRLHCLLPHTYHDDEAPRTECTLMKSDLLAYELYDTQGTNVEGDNGVYCECTRQNEAAHAKREHPLERSA